MSNTDTNTNGAAPEAVRTKQFEVQWGVKWTNFTATVEATSPNEAYKKALELPREDFTVTAERDYEQISSLSGLLSIAQENRVQIHDTENGDECDFRDESTVEVEDEE